MTRPLCCVVLLTSVGVLTGLSQTQQGNWELSTSGTFGSLSTATVQRSPLGGSSTSTYSATYAIVGLRLGYYVIDGLVIEPEVLLSAIEKWSPAYIVSANVAYNYHIPDANLSPFVLAGYGVGNSVPSLVGAPLVIGRISASFDIPVLQLGAGIKYHVSDHAAIRSEYRYQRYTYDQTFGIGITSSTTLHYHTFLIGVSVFLY